MSTLGFIGLVLLAILLVGAPAYWILGRSRPARPEPPAAPRPPALTVPELKERLGKLAAKAPAEVPAPPPGPTAMCYSKAVGPPPTTDHVCPVDGSRTQHAGTSATADAVRGLSSLRLAAKQLPGLDASLDESAMCRQCAPEKSGGVALVIRHPDGREVQTEDVTELDLQLLREFLSGNATFVGPGGERVTLKDWLPRIHQLLGIPEK